jgi:multiple sugar transport system permease protein
VAPSDAQTPALALHSVGPSVRRRERRRTGQTSGRLNWASGALLAPFAILFALFFVVPIVYAIVQSFLGSEAGGLGLSAPTVKFVGFANYVQVIADPDFGAGFGRIGIFAVINIPITLGLALLIALLLDLSSMPFRGFFRIVYFLPYAIPGVVSGILWAFLYSPSLSPYSQLSAAVGAGQVDFLSPQVVLFAIANIVIWQFAGYNMLILTASLNAIPTEQYEAARIDGCGRLREALYIKIPQLVPALVMTVLFAIIGTLQLFNEPLILSLITKSVTSTYTPNLMAYTEAFSNNNSYLAAAISVLLAVLTAIASFIFLSIVNKRSAL